MQTKPLKVSATSLFQHKVCARAVNQPEEIIDLLVEAAAATTPLIRKKFSAIQGWNANDHLACCHILSGKVRLQLISQTCPLSLQGLRCNAACCSFPSTLHSVAQQHQGPRRGRGLRFKKFAQDTAAHILQPHHMEGGFFHPLVKLSMVGSATSASQLL